MMDTIDPQVVINPRNKELKTEHFDMNASPVQRYSNEIGLKEKLDEIRDTRQMFFKNCTKKVIEIDTEYGTIRINPNQYGKFQPINKKLYGKFYLKSGGLLKQMNYIMRNEDFTNISTNDNKWFVLAKGIR